MRYESFAAFFDAVVRPMVVADPGRLRLDGQRSGGNRTPAGWFRHADRLWRVHGDSHVDPLVFAFNAMTSGAHADPFEVSMTKSGYRLDRRADLAQQRSSSHRDLYIYSPVPRY